MQYVRNTWYPIAWSHDITRALTRRTIVEQNVALYRSSDGSVVALAYVRIEVPDDAALALA